MQYDGYSATTSHATSSCFVTEIIFLKKIPIFAHKQTTGILKHVIFPCM